MAETWYQTLRLTSLSAKAKIKEVEVVSSSAHFVTLRNHDGSLYREPRYTSNWYCYFETRDEAIEQLREDSAALIARFETDLACARARAEEIERLAAEVHP
jgi:hypothetical protein